MTTTCLSCLLCEQFSPTKRRLVESRCRIDGAARDASSVPCMLFLDKRKAAQYPTSEIESILRYARRGLVMGRSFKQQPLIGGNKLAMPAELL